MFNFQRVRKCEPLPMLLVSSAIRRIHNNHPDSKWVATNCYNEYAGHMGLYTSIGIPIGKKPGEAYGSQNYLPIQSINVSNLHEESLRRGAHIGDIIDNKSKKMAKVLSRGNRTLEDILSYLFREKIRNVPEHSGASDVWLCAQYWPTYDLVELALLDEGRGVFKSLSSNSALKDFFTNDYEALIMSIRPGISSSFSPLKGPKQSDDFWENSGYGLYMASQICVRLGGDFLIVSGNSGLSLNIDDGNMIIKEYITHFQGTAIRMRIKVSRVSEYSQVHRELISQGETLTKDSTIAFRTASKASRGLDVFDL